MTKDVVVCCDGTWGGGTRRTTDSTNIKKLADLFAGKEISEKVSLYV